MFMSTPSLHTIIPLRDLLKEIILNHSDPNNPDYNECDKEPCAWCLSAIIHYRMICSSHGYNDTKDTFPDDYATGDW